MSDQTTTTQPRPSVSVLMLAYNHERYADEAIRSVLSQRLNVDFEVVIGEDCSTDQTRSVLERWRQQYPEKIQIRQRKQNLGLVGNFIDTYHACRGEFVAVISCDDYWTVPEKLQRQYDAMQQHPSWSMCFHATRIRDESGIFAETRRPPQEFPRESGFNDILLTNFVPAVSAFWRKSLIPRLPDWFSRLNFEDWPLHALFSVHGPIGYLPETMSVYRYHPRSFCSLRSEEARLAHVWGMYDLLAAHFASDAERLPVVRAARDNYGFEMARENDELREQYRNLRQSVSYRLGIALTNPARWGLRLWHRFK